MLNFFNAILGGALLLAGRKLFWLLVGAIGFVIGVEVAARFFHGSDLMTFLVGLVLGIIFAVLAVFVESIAIGIAGFLGGGYILQSLAAMLGFDKGALVWIAFIVGGIIGVILVAALLDWALITISSLAGASMVLHAFRLGQVNGGLLFLVLVIIGVAVQGSVLRRERHGHHHD